ncbi:hypothetical protein GGR57DRAFT_491479 [Xylariaceae sp. FL1272]|nr:hypothetical protein GGR57DRAFT_491479 [Xylariaceae sp. FL1272]
MILAALRWRTITSIASLFLFYNFRQTLNSAAVPILHSHIDPLICPESPLLQDVLVVIRTGATEVREKLPVHFQTVLKCVPDYIIFSDFEEDIEGHHAFDVLDQTTDNVRITIPEFWLYNKLRAGGRNGLEYQTSYGSGVSGALENPGWKLDKWKFLPMVYKSLQHRPNAKWFVFVEPDTYLIWQNMLDFLSKLDPEKPQYRGRFSWIGDVFFAHGGSGFVLSNPAAKMATEHWKSKQDWFDEYTAKEWAGDMVLGKIMKDVGIDLISASPHTQGDSVFSIDWATSSNWCYPSLTFHHMTNSEIKSLWQLDQAWLRYNQTIVRFRDVFKNFILPHLESERSEWDNMSEGTEYSHKAISKLSSKERTALSQVDKDAQESFEKCRVACESKFSCMQFSYVPGKCLVSDQLRLGHEAGSRCLEFSTATGQCTKHLEDGAQGASSLNSTAVRSGWIMNRVLDMPRRLDEGCQAPEGSDWSV